MVLSPFRRLFTFVALLGAAMLLFRDRPRFTGANSRSGRR
jgi:hypothetical protein